VATYHVVAGVAAAYASIDALLVFFNFWLVLGLEDRFMVDRLPFLSWLEPSGSMTFRNRKFVRALKRAAPPGMDQPIRELRALEREVGPYRHRALHRDGLRAVGGRHGEPWRLHVDRYQTGIRAGDEYGWSPPMGQRSPTGDEPPVEELLRNWADRLESIISLTLVTLAPMTTPENRPAPLSPSTQPCWSRWREVVRQFVNRVHLARK
jgi:hypothetical protein